MMTPEGALKALIEACGPRNRITVLPKAEATAADHFNLRTKERIYEFIASGGIENPRFICKSVWRKDPQKINPPVYEYAFYSHQLHGYLAFVIMPNGFIVIKSFKKNREEDQRNFALKDGLSALLGKTGDGE